MCKAELGMLFTEHELHKLCNLHWSEWNNYAIQQAEENHFDLTSLFFTHQVAHNHAMPLPHYLNAMGHILSHDSILHHIARWGKDVANSRGAGIPFDEIISGLGNRGHCNEFKFSDTIQLQRIRFVIGQLGTGYSYEHSKMSKLLQLMAIANMRLAMQIHQ